MCYNEYAKQVEQIFKVFLSGAPLFRTHLNFGETENPVKWAQRYKHLGLFQLIWQQSDLFFCALTSVDVLFYNFLKRNGIS